MSFTLSRNYSLQITCLHKRILMHVPFVYYYLPAMWSVAGTLKHVFLEVCSEGKIIDGTCDAHISFILFYHLLACDST